MLAISALIQTLFRCQSSQRQAVRHLRQVGNDCLAVNVLAERERNSLRAPSLCPNQSIEKARAISP
jgi:hypothetical protein